MVLRILDFKKDKLYIYKLYVLRFYDANRLIELIKILIRNACGDVVVCCGFWTLRKMEELIVDDIPIFPKNPKRTCVSVLYIGSG